MKLPQSPRNTKFVSVFPHSVRGSRFRISTTLNTIVTSHVTLEMSPERTKDKKKKKGRGVKNFFFFSLYLQTKALKAPSSSSSLHIFRSFVADERFHVQGKSGKVCARTCGGLLWAQGAKKRKLKPHESIVGCVTGGLFLQLPSLFSLLSPRAAEASCIISKFMASAAPGPYTLSEFTRRPLLLLFSTFRFLLPSFFHSLSII